MSEEIATDLAAQRGAVLHHLIDLVRLSRVSADPAFAQGMANAQTLLQARLREAGLDANAASFYAGFGSIPYGDPAFTPHSSPHFVKPYQQ